MFSRFARYERHIDLGAGLLLFALGFALNYFFAWQKSIIDLPDGGMVTDTAWRLVNGQIPYEDFGSIQGIGAALLEAPFILIFGESLLPLVVHVSSVNGTAALLCFAIMRMVGLRLPVALFFAVCTAIIFYTPLGMAFSIQHGGFYALVAMTLGIWSEWKRPAWRLRVAAWVFCGIFLSLTLVSKVTAGFYFPAFLPLLFIEWQRTAVFKILAVGTGAVLPFALILLFANDAAYTLQGILDYIIRLPGEYGGHRLKGSLNDALKVYEMSVTPTVLVTFGLFFVGLTYWFSIRKEQTGRFSAILPGSVNGNMLLVVSGALLQLGAVYVARIHDFTVYTMQQLVFVAGGMTFAGVANLFGSNERELAEQTRRDLAIVARSLVAVIVFVAGFDAWWNHSNVNKNRGFKDMGSAFFARVQVPDELVYPEIEGVRFREYHSRWLVEDVIGTDEIKKSLREDNAAIAFLRNYPDNVVLIGLDYIYYMYSGKPSPLPVISVQPGASSPHHTSPLYPKTVARLRENFEKQDIRAALISDVRFEPLEAFINDNGELFCSVDKHPYFYEVRFCDAEVRPKDWAVKMAHLVGMDGHFFGNSGPQRN
ncbi:MAG: hypothetical protein JJ900_12770 [Rhodospirillales bacterium]|nr:hypothetical protein [Rhodospirillales bacterium]MBO6787718.1 hypothetical protein [Rhodospirillales bacterium]